MVESNNNNPAVLNPALANVGPTLPQENGPHSNIGYYRNYLIDQEKAQILAEIDKLKHGKGGYAFWYMAQVLLGKLEQISDDLKMGLITYANALEKVSGDLAKVLEDIKQLEEKYDAKGQGNDWDHPIATPPSADDKKLIQSLVNDLKQLKQDTAVFKSMPEQYQKMWGQGNYPKRILATVDMIFNQKTGKSGDVNNCITHWNNGDTAPLIHFLNTCINAHGKNPKDQNDVFYMWTDAGEDGSDGLDPLNQSLSNQIGDNNDLLNKDGQLINTIYGVDQQTIQSVDAFLQTVQQNLGKGG
ncbi:MAG: hypothetical protein JXA94_00550 [Parachlamydiales bacterium]|nr:hypothetical protein [Parachlamydiales bacterium]